MVSKPAINFACGIICFLYTFIFVYPATCFESNLGWNNTVLPKDAPKIKEQLVNSYPDATFHPNLTASGDFTIMVNFQNSSNTSFYHVLARKEFDFLELSQISIPFFNIKSFDFSWLSISFDKARARISSFELYNKDSFELTSEDCLATDLKILSNENNIQATGTLICYYRNQTFTYKTNLKAIPNDQWTLELKNKFEDNPNETFRAASGASEQKTELILKRSGNEYVFGKKTVSLGNFGGLVYNSTYLRVAKIKIIKEYESLDKDSTNNEVQHYSFILGRVGNSIELNGTLKGTSQGEGIYTLSHKSHEKFHLKQLLVPLEVFEQLVKLDNLLQDEVEFIDLGIYSGINNKGFRLSGTIGNSSNRIRWIFLCLKLANTVIISLPPCYFAKIMNSYYSLDKAFINSFKVQNITAVFSTNGVSFDSNPGLKPYRAWFVNTSDILMGFTIYIEFKISEQPECVLLKYFDSLFGYNKIFSFKFNIKNTEEATNFFSVSDVALGSNILIKEGSFYLKLNSKGFSHQEFGIKALIEVTLSGQKILFAGKTKLSTSEIFWNMELRGPWKNPFGIENLSLVSPSFSAKVSFSGKVTELIMGSGFSLGLSCNKRDRNHCLRGDGYGGIYISNPEKNFFYFEVIRLDWNLLLVALLGSDIDNRESNVFNDIIKFPKGILISYSLLPQEISDKWISDGLRLKSEIIFFEHSALIDFTYKPLRLMLDATIQLPRLNFNNLLIIEGLKENEGLNFSFAFMTSSVYLNVKIFARVYILGDNVVTQLSLDSAGLEISAIFNLFQGKFHHKLNVLVNYNSSGEGIFIKVSGKFLINSAVDDLTSNVCKRVALQLLEAKKKLNNLREKLDLATKELQLKRKELKIKSKKNLLSALTCKPINATVEVKDGEEDYECDQKWTPCKEGWKKYCKESLNYCKNTIFKPLEWVCDGLNIVCLVPAYICKSSGKVCKAYNQINKSLNPDVKKKFCKFNTFLAMTFYWAIKRSSKIALKNSKNILRNIKSLLEISEKKLGSLAKAANVMGTSFSEVFKIINIEFNFLLQNFSSLIEIKVESSVFGKDFVFYATIDFTNQIQIINEICSIVVDYIKGLFS